MSENATPKFWSRLALLGVAVSLPVLAGFVLVFFAATTVMVGSSDRALLWAEGSQGELDALGDRVTHSPWFPQGRMRAAAADVPSPTPCGRDAREYSFGGLRAEQAQAARSTLESYARDAGASVCQTNTFIINEHPDPVATSVTGRLASALLQSALIPCGIALLGYWAFAAQLNLPPTAGTQPVSIQLRAGAIAALLGSLGLSGIALMGSLTGESTASTAGTLTDLGPYLMVAILVSEPLLEELAFRAWLIPIAERAIGTASAAVLSILLFAAMHLPFGGMAFTSALIVGSVLAATFVRTRSLLACVVANALMAGVALLMY